MPRSFPDPSQIDNNRLSPVNNTPIRDIDSLVTSLDKTNLDNTDIRPNNPPADPTVYSEHAKSSETIKGTFATPGKPASKFEQKYSPTTT
jgi:hypothetical protein